MYYSLNLHIQVCHKLLKIIFTIVKIRYYVGTEHASGKDVSSDKAVLSDPRVRVPGGGHEMGGQG